MGYGEIRLLPTDHGAPGASIDYESFAVFCNGRRTYLDLFELGTRRICISASDEEVLFKVGALASLAEVDVTREQVAEAIQACRTAIAEKLLREFHGQES